MSLPQQHSWNEPQRQAKAGLLILLTNAATRLLKICWPILLVVLFKGNRKGVDSFEITLIVLPVIVLVRSLVEFYYFRFFILNDQLTIRKGFISKKTITIPLNKIQGVHIEQGLLHQLVEVAKIKIDTAGTEKTEAVIDAIAVKKAEQLKEFLLHENQPTTGIEGEPLTLVVNKEQMLMQLSPVDLLKLGISANHLQALFIVLAFALSLTQNLGEIFGDRVYQTIEDSGNEFGSSVAAISLLIAAILLISVLVSLIRILLKYFDFRLSETANGFKIKTGLINSQQTLVPFNKIQFISWDANWIRRKIGLYTLEFHQVTGDERQSKKQRVRVPLTQFSYIDQLLTHYHGIVESSSGKSYGIERAYIFRRTLWYAILPSSVIAVILLLTTGSYWWLLLLLYIPLIAIQAWSFRNNFFLYMSPEALQLNTGIWGRKTEIVQWYKAQQVLLDQSIYQRQHNLATIKLGTAGGTITIPYISLELAHTIRNYVLFKTESTDRHWM